MSQMAPPRVHSRRISSVCSGRADVVKSRSALERPSTASRTGPPTRASSCPAASNTRPSAWISSGRAWNIEAARRRAVSRRWTVSAVSSTGSVTGGVLSWIGRRERGPALHHGLVEVSCTCRLPTVTAAYSVTMPSSQPSVRPVLAALLTVVLLTAAALVSGPATLVPAARAENPAPAPQAPSAPPDGDADTPVSMDLVSLTPTSLDPGGTLEAQIDVTNTSSEPVSELELELRTRTARVTDREALTEWQSDTSAQPRGEALAASDP